MGKWAEVRCNCPNRVPLPGSDSYFGQPHRKKHRLSKKEQAEVEEWERSTKNMFECGHRGGVVVEFCPANIIQLGNLIGKVFSDERTAFEIFRKVGDWRSYQDELLLIEPNEARLWQVEIEEVQRAMQGSGKLSQQKVEQLVSEFLREDLGSRLHLEGRLNEIEAKMPSAAIGALKRNVQKTQGPDLESTLRNVLKALTDASKLCRAGIETGNPIRLMW